MLAFFETIVCLQLNCKDNQSKSKINQICSFLKINYKKKATMPVVIGMPTTPMRSGRMARQNIEEGGGIKICCCRVFTCVNPSFLLTNHGLMKISEVVLGSCCQTLLVRFGVDSASDIGQAFQSCLSTVSSCLLVSTLLLFCYIISTRTFNLVRQSLFVSKNREICLNISNIC